MAEEYELRDRYTIPCAHCHGEGCQACRGGEVPVYVIETGVAKLRCSVLGHNQIGAADHVENEGQLPRICWCMRCTWRRVQTDVPEAYQVVA
jgi:hypothetical protein